MDWLDLLAVQGTLKSLLQHHTSKASILLHSALFTVHFSHPYMITGKTIALTRQTFVGKVMSLLFNMLSRLVKTFLPRNKHLLISWLQSPSEEVTNSKFPTWNPSISYFTLMLLSSPLHAHTLQTCPVLPPWWDGSLLEETEGIHINMMGKENDICIF